MITSENFKQYEDLIEGVRQGKTIQVSRDGGKSAPWKDLKEGLSFIRPPSCYRLKPDSVPEVPAEKPHEEVEHIDLEVGDIVPGCIFRHKSWPEKAYAQHVAAGLFGIVVPLRPFTLGNPNPELWRVSWRELHRDWLYRNPGGSEWLGCRKLPSSAGGSGASGDVSSTAIAEDTGSMRDCYLLKIIGDVEPHLFGPFDDPGERDAAAVRHRDGDPEMKDGLFRLDIEFPGHLKSEDVRVEVSPFAGGEFENGN